MTTVDVNALYHAIDEALTAAGRGTKYCLDMSVWNHRREDQSIEIEWSIWIENDNKFFRGATPEIALAKLRAHLIPPPPVVTLPTVTLPDVTEAAR